MKAVPPLSRLQPPGASPAAAAGQYFGHLCPLPVFSRSCPLGGGPGMSPGTATPAARVALAGMGPRGDTEGGGGTRRGAAEGQGQSWDALGLCWDDLGLCWELKGQFRVVLGQLGQGLEGAGTILARFRTAQGQAGSPGGIQPPSLVLVLSVLGGRGKEREKERERERGRKKRKRKGRGRETGREGEEEKEEKGEGKREGEGKGEGTPPRAGCRQPPPPTCAVRLSSSPGCKNQYFAPSLKI